MVMFDTNMILRYLLNDHAEMAEKAEHHIAAGDVTVTLEVIAEVVYVLKGVYALERDKIVDTLKRFMNLVGCRESDVLDLALDTFGERNLDFVDCVLFAYHKLQGVKIATFDRKLLKLMSQ